MLLDDEDFAASGALSLATKLVGRPFKQLFALGTGKRKALYLYDDFIGVAVESDCENISTTGATSASSIQVRIALQVFPAVRAWNINPDAWHFVRSKNGLSLRNKQPCFASGAAASFATRPIGYTKLTRAGVALKFDWHGTSYTERFGEAVRIDRFGVKFNIDPCLNKLGTLHFNITAFVS